MNRSSRFTNILNKRSDLWADSESDSSSNQSDNENLSTNCCLICSVLPNLSNINTCEKHLNLITQPLKSAQVVYMMSPAINNCHCRRKSKHRCRSSSSSSSEVAHRRKKRIITIELSVGSISFTPINSSVDFSQDSSSSSSSNSDNELFFSPDVKSQVNPTE